MINYLRRLILFVRYTPLCVKGDPEWTDEDRDALERFMSTVTGKKLAYKMDLMSQNMNALSVDRGTPVACGYAQGVRGMTGWLKALSAKSEPQSDTNYSFSSPGEDDLAERSSP